MYHFIMRQHKNIIFTLVVTHCKGHLIVVVLTEKRIQLHIIEEIMHPAHIPLIAEIKSIILYRTGHLRPCCRFLRNHHCSRISSENDRINMFEKLNGLQIFISAIFVCHPLSILLSVIQIKHGGHCIHTQSVNMVIFHPH